MILLITGIGLAIGSLLWNKAEENYQRDLVHKYIEDKKNYKIYFSQLDRSIKHQLAINIVLAIVWVGWVIVAFR